MKAHIHKDFVTIWVDNILVTTEQSKTAFFDAKLLMLHMLQSKHEISMPNQNFCDVYKGKLMQTYL